MNEYTKAFAEYVAETWTAEDIEVALTEPVVADELDMVEWLITSQEWRDAMNAAFAAVIGSYEEGYTQ